ncbi:[acyl-carrier-protein] S-malonyltransferase [Alkalibacterium subtropicum]|uniref:Malonyl CoA-acyl carrier protein transacylase n=1 Tax=Alkalibacterium subtropicum TaxID=753702 RepID=A0A1I1EPW7_9LACT|nr:ACP S-malonyltransferase [Alkalibacterium subtropicum]SFB88702.1 [acyl-carrier-protein] S-malonyltransferase [Alkalibacterium subtropicum]
MKTAFLFSGQGAQYNEMGKDFYEEYSEVREIFDSASKQLDTDLAEICFNSDARLSETPYTQPAILTVSYAIEHILKKSLDIMPDAVAGLSLGEYTALVSSGALSFEEAVLLVHQRGSLMEKAVPTGEGAMAAILGLEAETLIKICDEVSKESYVAIANFNTPDQLVISGKAKGVKKAMAKAVDSGAKRAIPLNVSGPFHTELLEPAGRAFKKSLEKVDFKAFTVPVYSNVTADLYPDTEAISPLLTRQISSPVKFEQMVSQMISDGVTTFIEVGPGKTLRSFVKSIDKSVTVKNIEKVKQIETIRKVIQS